MEQQDERVLWGIRCTKCKSVFMPGKYVCPNCHSLEFDRIRLKGEGRICSYTTIYVPPESFKDQAPYDLAIIELKEKGVKLTGRLTREEGMEIAIDKLVIFEKDDQYGKWFKVL